ncbi:hypothetical protein C4D60_Mb06t16470 [Musa balbisiana]|uniref:Uncharacterized protein n=1 Tax=Musa balbisiana TaxID=52838 RepID=A0A4S8ING1_MUSBA|nr:hypothetical protein C4D60_Mb06t16470 [Musa balbisiana]
MERASFVQTTFQSSLSFISLPPKPHLREPPIRSGVPRSDTAAGADHRFGLCVDDAERYYDEGHGGISGTVILDGAGERCNLSTHGGSSCSPRPMATRGTAGRVRSSRLQQARRRPAGTASRGSSPNPPGSIAVAASALFLKEPAKPPSFPACRLFGRNCPCYGRKSVDVDETCSEPKSSIRSGSDLNASSTAKNRRFRTGEMGLSSFLDRVIAEEIKNEFGFKEMIKVNIIPGNRPKNPSFLANLTRSSLPAEVGCRMVNSSSLFGYSHVFSCPVLNPSSLNNLAEDPARESLEVFQSTRHTAVALSTPPDSQLAAVVFPFSDQTTYRRPDSLDSRDHLRGGLEAEVPPPSNAPSEASVTTATSGRSASAAPPRAGGGDAAVF